MDSKGKLFYKWPSSNMRMLLGLDFHFSGDEKEALWEPSITQTLWGWGCSVSLPFDLKLFFLIF